MIKGFYRNIIQNLGFLFNKHRSSERPNVLLFSLPRSGSTWLQELIWTQPDFKYINEPLNLKGKRLREKSGINGFEELYTPEVRDKLLRYLKGFTSGKNHFLNPNPLRGHSRLFTSRVVFKIIHGGESYINDIADATNGRIVYLLRNPIAVALSRRQLPRIEQLSSEYVLKNFSSEERNLALDVFAEGDAMEKRIMAWCIQNRLALKSRNFNWLVISYEELTISPEKVIRSLAKHCELPDVELMLKRIKVPSAVTSQSQKGDIDWMKGGVNERLRLIQKWKERVSAKDAERYFEICRQMNFEIYTKDADLPHSSYLVESVKK